MVLKTHRVLVDPQPLRRSNCPSKQVRYPGHQARRYIAFSPPDSSASVFERYCTINPCRCEVHENNKIKQHQNHSRNNVERLEYDVAQ
ncbi:hypothetical protein ECG_04180 [Echinococcus granulosus]|uniref:Expressed protein n=1 Tax=Echinococcus granulosus TaxID=6210 RepID=A0A068WIM5_ECHGR|nr:hypothetical protein ECG_04180 [Echinococcus granulosus]CDS17543.1 expressed protein [Echinococcus granulosus]